MDAATTGSLAAELVGRAEGLVPVLAEHAREAEQARNVPQAVIDATADAGLFEIVTPTRWGGHGLGLGPLTTVTRTLARGCPAQAWTLSFLMMHTWLVTRFPDEAQAEAFAQRPYVHVPAPLAPTGRFEPVDGGFRFSGRWEWATGVNHAEWVMVHGIGDDLETRFALVPIDEVEVVDVWHVSGMCATGSNTVVLDGVVVPAHRTTPGMALLDADHEANRDRARQSPLDDLPVITVLALMAAAPAVGAAERAVALFKERVAERVLAYTLGDRQVDEPAAQIRLAEAMAGVRAAAAPWEQAIAGLEASAAAGERADIHQRAEGRLAAAAAVRGARRAIADICEAAGASPYALANPLQRLQRDVEVLKGHAVFDWDRTAQLVGRVALGLPLGDLELI